MGRQLCYRREQVVASTFLQVGFLVAIQVAALLCKSVRPEHASDLIHALALHVVTLRNLSAVVKDDELGRVTGDVVHVDSVKVTLFNVRLEESLELRVLQQGKYIEMEEMKGGERVRGWSKRKRQSA